MTNYTPPKHHGITHFVPMWALKLWKRFMCPRGFHAFDEVHTLDGIPPDLRDAVYIWCDACGLSVFVERIVEESD